MNDIVTNEEIENAKKVREWLESDSYKPLFLPIPSHGERMFVRMPATKERFDYVYSPSSTVGTDTGVSFNSPNFRTVLIWDNVDKTAFNIDGARLGISDSDAIVVLGAENNPRLELALDEIKAMLYANISGVVLGAQFPDQFRDSLGGARRWGYIDSFVMYDEYSAWFDEVITKDIARLVQKPDNDADVLYAVENPEDYVNRRITGTTGSNRYGLVLSEAVAVHECFSDILNDTYARCSRDEALAARSMYKTVRDLPSNIKNVRIVLKDEAGGEIHTVSVSDFRQGLRNLDLRWALRKVSRDTKLTDVQAIKHGHKTLWEATDNENDN